MDRSNFDRLITILDSWSDAADDVNDHGTKLIGHEPSIAPRAYRHVVYAGLTADQYNEFESRFGRSIPAEYLEILAVANGMMLFSGAIRFYGYVQLDRWGGASIHNFPPNVMVANNDAWLSNASGGRFAIGWYKEDGSHVYVDPIGRAVRINSGDNEDLASQWNSISHWLTAEIERLSESESDRE